MIKFFRKIRQKLLTENKFSKYLLYAVGEILLVVIGILIAVQMNNSNQYNSNERELHSSYQSLSLDLEKDLIHFNEVNAQIKGMKESATSIQLLLLGKNDISDILALKDNFRIWNHRLSYNNGTYQTLLGTGLLYKSKNKEVILQINDYYTELEQSRSNMESMSSTNRTLRDQEVLMPFLYITNVDKTVFSPHTNSLLWMNDPQSQTFQAVYIYMGKTLSQLGVKRKILNKLIAKNESVQKSIRLILDSK